MQSDYIFTKKGDELAQGIQDKIIAFQDYAVSTGKFSQWKKNQRFYENDYFGVNGDADIVDTGDVGELKALAFNHFRNILRHMLNQLTAITPAFDVSATNTDRSSRRSAKIGKEVINYYIKVKRITKHTHKVAERALVHGDGFLVAEWNPSIGKKITKDDNGKLIREGDFDFCSSSVYNTFFDYSKDSKDNWDWFSFRRKRNKYDLAKIFPKMAKRILALGENSDLDKFSSSDKDFDVYGMESPDVYVYSTYHKATNAIENGKFILHCSDGGSSAFTLYEGDNLYGEALPVFPLSPAEYIESAFGFTEANILRAPQMVINTIISSLFSNASSAGANNIWTPTGANLNIEELVDGMSWITSDSDKKPEVISFYQDTPGLKDLLNLCNNTMETLSGQNAAVRGNVQDTPNLKSGVAIATVINMAQQYSQALEKSYIEMFEDVTSFLLATLKKVANTERLIDITGKLSVSSVNTFTKEDLSGISRVIVDRTNPITKQPAGKIEIAMELLKIGQITPVQFFDVMNTGNLDVAVEADERMLDFIAGAKEKLMDGETIPPIPGINHQLYIKEIHSLLFDTEILNNEENQQVLQNILQTIQQQMDILRGGDEIANLIYGGQQPVTPAVDQQGELDPESMAQLGSASQAPMQGSAEPAQPAAGPLQQ